MTTRSRRSSRRGGSPPERGSTDSGVNEALSLAMSAGLPFRGLRNREIDYRLFSYLPFDLAKRESLLPLSLDGGALTVAATNAQPDLTEIQATFPALPLRVVIAAGPEIRSILDRVGAAVT